MKSIVLQLSFVGMCAAALSGCGTIAENSDVGVVHVAGRQTVATQSNVEITATGPAATSSQQNVVGTSCMNKLWDPPPSQDNAINLMKKQAAERGFNAIHSLKIAKDSTAVFKNCWSIIEARGVAYKK